jgi:hypothetical protein
VSITIVAAKIVDIKIITWTSVKEFKNIVNLHKQLRYASLPCLVFQQIIFTTSGYFLISQMSNNTVDFAQTLRELIIKK